MDELVYKRDVIKAICEDGTWLESQGCTEITMAERKQRDVDIIESLPPVQLGTNLAEVGTDLVSKRAAIDAPFKKFDMATGVTWIPLEYIEKLPAAQPEQRTCVNCGRTVNNGGWYADGGTRCPIEEHYALPKDGYCHLWEKRNVTDDDYPERREE